MTSRPPDTAPAPAPRDDAADAASFANRTAQWRALADELSRVLLGLPSPAASAVLEDAASRLVALVESSPDGALFRVVHLDDWEDAHYGVVRSLQAAIAALVAATRLGWPAPRRLTLVKAALTMNVAMLDLQARLSNQARLPGAAQRQAVLAHPARSVRLLQASGIADAEWLEAVAQHHERPGGGGYPAGLDGPGEMADALRIAEIYTAKLASRSGRDPLPPDRALRELLGEARGNAFALALAAEFGPWPPGTAVRLQDGAAGLVLERGADGTPVIAVLVDGHGEVQALPRRRPADARRGIAAAIDPRALRARVGVQTLRRAGQAF
jgi:hypothetical protein